MNDFNKKDKMFGREVKTLDIYLENEILLDIICDFRDSLSKIMFFINCGITDDSQFNTVKIEAQTIIKKYKNTREFVESELKKIEEMRKK